MTEPKKKKLLFLITKSNWGEKARGAFARLTLLVCEFMNKQVSEWTASVRWSEAVTHHKIYFL